MKKILSNIFVFILLISFFIASIFFITLKISFIRSFYNYFYTKNNLAWYLDISNKQLLSYTENLLNYLKTGQQLDSSWYTKKDILHMIDVRSLYQNSLTLMYIFFCIAIISGIFLFMLKKKNTVTFVINSFNKVFIIFTFLILSLGIYIVIDFNSFWINFHLLIFDNDLWLLSPSESNLIKMFPEDFFFLLVSIIVGVIISYFILLLLLVKIIKNKL